MLLIITFPLAFLKGMTSHPEDPALNAPHSLISRHPLFFPQQYLITPLPEVHTNSDVTAPSISLTPHTQAMMPYQRLFPNQPYMLNDTMCRIGSCMRGSQASQW